MARSLSVALIGGMRMGGRMKLNESLTRIALIGGLNLDLSEAEFAAGGRLTIFKMSKRAPARGPGHRRSRSGASRSSAG